MEMLLPDKGKVLNRFNKLEREASVAIFPNLSNRFNVMPEI